MGRGTFSKGMQCLMVKDVNPFSAIPVAGVMARRRNAAAGA
jgi:hypothetical protein